MCRRCANRLRGSDQLFNQRAYRESGSLGALIPGTEFLSHHDEIPPTRPWMGRHRRPHGVVPETEHALRRMLSPNAGRAVPYDMLVRQVWNGREHAGPNLLRIVLHRRQELAAVSPLLPLTLFVVVRRPPESKRIPHPVERRLRHPGRAGRRGRGRPRRAPSFGLHMAAPIV